MFAAFWSEQVGNFIFKFPFPIGALDWLMLSSMAALLYSTVICQMRSVLDIFDLVTLADVSRVVNRGQ